MNDTPQNAYATTPGGVRIAYRATGPADAPAILFCTMATAAFTVWEGIARALCGDWRVIVHDRRGDGDSDPGTLESHTFQAYVADALAVLDADRRASAVVCGMAFGARVALHLARDWPKRVNGLILFDATGGPPAPEPERAAGQAEAARLRAEAGLPAPAFDKQWFHRRDRSAATFARNALRGQPPWMTDLETIRAPTLVACGEQDPNLRGAMRIAQEIDGAIFEPMPMTGHASILERPDLVLSLTSSFLEQLAGSARKRGTQ